MEGAGVIKIRAYMTLRTSLLGTEIPTMQQPKLLKDDSKKGSYRESISQSIFVFRQAKDNDVHKI